MSAPASGDAARPDERDLTYAALGYTEQELEIDALQRTEGNVVHEVQAKPGEPAGPLRIVLENQTSVDRFLGLRLLQYSCATLVSARNDPDRGERLPQVLPMVMYLGPRPWPYPKSWKGMFADVSPLHSWGPSIDYVLSDYASEGPAAIVGHPQARAALMSILAVTGPPARRQETIELLAQELVVVWRLERSEVDEVFLYLTQQDHMEVAMAVQDALEQQEERGPARQWRTVADQLRDEGRIEERVEVIERFLGAGAEWGLIEAATGLTEKRFERLKAEVAARVAKAKQEAR